ncbi:MAG: hypothetical protein H6Q16_1668 [Bacteroidetes bacterium]|nr:hypothetical protein [Bacteroidota bacterium]
MKRVYLLALFGLCFLFITPNQVFCSNFFKEREVKIKVKNCELDKTSILANKIEFKVKGDSHNYKIIGGNLMKDTYVFKFDPKTINDFKEIDLTKILNTILNNIENGVVKGCGEESFCVYSWKAKLVSEFNGTYDIKIEIEED